MSIPEVVVEILTFKGNGDILLKKLQNKKNFIFAEANTFKMKKYRYRLSYTQSIAISFVLMILVGAFLLSLPISSRTREWTPFLDSLFTSTSATCVTGLVVYDTYTHWSLFGQLVLLFLIQVGGLGFITIMCLFFHFGEKAYLFTSA